MADTIRVGIIGLDTSHVKAFTEIWNDTAGKDHVDGVKVVAAYPSSSPDIERSVRGVKEYKPLLANKHGVKMTASIPELVEQVDAIMIESVDGRRHLPELKAVLESKAWAGKPIYVDKPFSASLADAREMVKLLREHKAPCFSSSSLRFEPNLVNFLADEKVRGKVQGCDAFSPASLEPTNPGFFWYGIHGVEILFTAMGRGIKSVRCSNTPDVDMAVGIWDDGRIGTMRGIRGKQHADYGAFIMCEKVFKQITPDPGTNRYYHGLVTNVTKFFQTKKSPVPIEETLEICAFIQAAWDSSQKDCGDIKIDLT